MIPGYHASAMIELDLATSGSVLRRIGYRAVAVRTSLAKLDPLADESTRVWQLGMLQAGLGGLSLVVDADGAFLVDPWLSDPPGLAEQTAESARQAEYLKAAVELVGELGGGLVTFSVGKVPQEQGLQGALDRLAEVVCQVSQLAERSGVVLAVRPRTGHLVDSVGSFERLLKWVGSDVSIGFAADVGVMVTGGEMPIVDLLARLGALLKCVYLSELRVVGVGLEPTLGSGHVSVRRVVAGLGAGGFTGPIILEPAVGCGLDARGAEAFFEQVFRRQTG